VIGGELKLLDFKDISAADVLQALALVIDRLREMGVGGVFDQQLPLINKSVSDLVDLGATFLDDVQTPGDDSVVSSAKKLEAFLNSKINPSNDPDGPHVQVVVRPDDIRFRLKVNKQFLRDDIPFAFDLEVILVSRTSKEPESSPSLRMPVSI
jgi:hypothetical protein